jgi:acetyl esterase/lipase
MTARRRSTRLNLTALAILVGCQNATSAASSSPQNRHVLMSPAEFQALPSRPADHRIAYGDDPNQYADLRLPPSAGPHPVVVLIHGGCWKAAYATLRDLAPMADALKAHGVATWNIEYRRLPQPGSGWPGTDLDVGRALDYLRSIAQKYRLDLDRVIVVGHSAGGHLAMWSAARTRLRPQSPLYVTNPLSIRGVIDLAGPGDMKAEIRVEMTACGGPVVETLLGGTPASVPERYEQASAINMLPLGVPQILIWGNQDKLRPTLAGRGLHQGSRSRRRCRTAYDRTWAGSL